MTADLSHSKSLKEVLISLGYQPKKVGDNYMMTALYRGGDNKNALAVHCRTGVFYDFVNKVSGSFEELVKLTTGEKKVDEYLQGLELEEIAEKIKTPTIFNKSTLELLFPNYIYWNQRGISDETLKNFKNGIVHSGKLYQRSCFPIINPDGRIVGYSGRLITEKENAPKWKHLGSKQYFVYPAFWNKEIIKETKRVFFVESIGDMISLWEAGIKNVLVTFGLYLSDKLLSYIVSIDLEEIHISLNNETNGRGNEAAEKMKIKLSSFFDNKKIFVSLPPKKDFNECSKKEINDWHLTLSKKNG